jgi:AraC-like DNA-binding protein
MTKARSATRVLRPHGFSGLELTSHRAPNRPAEFFLFDYSFGVRLEGTRRTTYRRNRFTTEPGTFLAYEAGEALTNTPASEGVWSFREISISPVLFRSLLEGSEQALPAHLGGPIASDMRLNAQLCQTLLDCHESFAQEASLLERETKLLNLLVLVLQCCSNAPHKPQTAAREAKRISVVKDYLHSHFVTNIALDELADIAQLNKHYLLRVFKNHVGISPHTYQKLLRIRSAKELLEQGLSIVEVALETGFTDQSHLHHQFKKYVGVTPGQYQQDNLR